jgi:FkbM family methyltransferase
MALPNVIIALLRRAGYGVVEERNSFSGRNKQFFARTHIDLLLDVGAHVGDYARQMRRLGYRGRIVSFEPLSSAFRTLQARAEADAAWTAVNAALGAEDGSAQLNISGMPMSSSLVEMLPLHVKAVPASRYVGTEEVTVRALDSIFGEYYRSGEQVFMKLDTQGFEKSVLAGAAQSLQHIVGLQVEMSLVPLYQAEALVPEMLDLLQSLGFQLIALEPGFMTATQLLQVYGLFARL